MEAGQLGEFTLIDRLLSKLSAGKGVFLGAGDDAAALVPAGYYGTLLLATCDSQVEGRHFLRSRISPEQLGQRLAAVNLSDIAAMGGFPQWALVSLALPPDTEVGFVEALYGGLDAELRRFGAAVVGGNVTGSETLVLDLTLLGEVLERRLLRRDRARPGDAILVSGSLGESAAGRAALNAGLAGPEAADAIRRHLTPEARVPVGRALSASELVSAAIDVSDGFAQDLGHICDASHVGAQVDEAALPISAATLAVAKELGLDAFELALTGGEDYELICTAAPSDAELLAALMINAVGVPLTRVGTVLPWEEGRWLRLPDGSSRPLAGGWQHFGRGSASP